MLRLRLPRRSPNPRPASPIGGRIDSHPIRLRFVGTLAGFEQAFNELREALDADNLTSSARARYNIELIFEEIVGNILRYGAPQGRTLHVAAQVHRDSERILVTIEDDGIPFDPCSSGANAGAPRTLAEAPDGGFGLMIVRQACSGMHYERTEDQRNRLTLSLSALG
jgi:anti-sigma regulatory factor (Ser/Thr protein kinase)